MYQAHTPWPSAATAAAVSAAFPDGRLTLGLPVVIKVVDYNPDDPEWSREMCEREEAACTAVNGCPWAPQLLWASHTESCSWFVFEALTPDPMVRANALQYSVHYISDLKPAAGTRPVSCYSAHQGDSNSTQSFLHLPMHSRFLPPYLTPHFPALPWCRTWIHWMTTWPPSRSC